MKKFVSGLLCGLLSVVFLYIKLQSRCLRKLEKERKNSDLNYMLYHTMDLWLILMQKGKSIAEYLEKNAYQNVAIYGMGSMGERLYDTLIDTNIHIKYGIDRNAKYIYTTLDLFNPEEELEEVDAIIVTAIYYYDEIVEGLSKKIDCPIISIRKIIEDILQE